MMLSVLIFQLVLSSCLAVKAVKLPDVHFQDTWEIDPSCDAHQDPLNKAYKETALLIRSALDDIATLEQKPPPYSTRTRISEYSNWARAQRLIYFIFGIKVEEREGYLDTIKDVFQTIDKAITSGRPIPERGHSGQVQKPLLLCGEDMWQWKGLDDEDPANPGQTLREARDRDINAMYAAKKRRPIGAWVYKDRVSLEVTRGMTKGECPSGQMALTKSRLDFMTLCPVAFSAAYSQSVSAVERKDQITVGDGVHLRDFVNTMSWLLVHEFAHYYGPQDGPGGSSVIEDHPAVNRNGDRLYNNGQGSAVTSPQDGNGKSFPPNLAYGTQKVVYLARTHQGKSNSGPAQASVNAETYAAYAITTYLKDWEWPDNNRPEVLPAELKELDRP